MARSDPKAELDLYMLALGFEREYPFVPGRRFRADYRLRDVLVEYEGGVFAGGDAGGHRAMGRYLRDIEKYSLAAALGYRVVRVTAKHVTSGQAFDWIEQAIG